MENIFPKQITVQVEICTTEVSTLLQLNLAQIFLILFVWGIYSYLINPKRQPSFDGFMLWELVLEL